jgi:signal transduction histidine kinase
VAVDAVDLCDVVDILVDNIFAHTPEGTGFRIALARDFRVARLTVQDFGPGVDATRGDGQRVGSSGLGQQIVRRAVSAFGGDATFESTPGRGVRVVVVLPGSPPTA